MHKKLYLQLLHIGLKKKKKSSQANNYKKVKGEQFLML